MHSHRFYPFANIVVPSHCDHPAGYIASRSKHKGWIKPGRRILRLDEQPIDPARVLRSETRGPTFSSACVDELHLPLFPSSSLELGIGDLSEKANVYQHQIRVLEYPLGRRATSLANIRSSTDRHRKHASRSNCLVSISTSRQSPCLCTDRVLVGLGLANQPTPCTLREISIYALAFTVKVTVMVGTVPFEASIVQKRLKVL